MQPFHGQRLNGNCEGTKAKFFLVLSPTQDCAKLFVQKKKRSQALATIKQIKTQFPLIAI
jgi:hypothetical protein